jgi:hypothetical protein
VQNVYHNLEITEELMESVSEWFLTLNQDLNFSSGLKKITGFLLNMIFIITFASIDYENVKAFHSRY